MHATEDVAFLSIVILLQHRVLSSNGIWSARGLGPGSGESRLDLLLEGWLLSILPLVHISSVSHILTLSSLISSLALKIGKC